MAALESYAEHTAGSLLLLTLECCGVREAAADAAASHVGTAVGLATLLRALPVHAAQGQRYVPDEVMAARGLTERELFVLEQDVAPVPGAASLEEQGQGAAAGAAAGAGGAGGAAGRQAAGRGGAEWRPPGTPPGPQAQAAERAALREAALRRLSGGAVLAAARASPAEASGAGAGGGVGAGAGAAAPAAPAAAPLSSGLSGRRSSAAPAPLAGAEAAEEAPRQQVGGAEAAEEAPRQLRMVGSRAVAARAPAGEGAAAPRAQARAGDHTLHFGGAQRAGGGGGEPPEGARRATLDSRSDDGASGEMGGFDASQSRLGAISAARGARAASFAPASGSAPASVWGGLPSPAAAPVRAAAAAPGARGPPLRLLKDPLVQARVRLAVGDLAAAAEAHLARARALRPALPPAALHALLPAVPAARLLARLRSQGHDVWAAGVGGPWRDTRALARLYLQLDLLRHALGGRY